MTDLLYSAEGLATGALQLFGCSASIKWKIMPYT